MQHGLDTESKAVKNFIASAIRKGCEKEELCTPDGERCHRGVHPLKHVLTHAVCLLISGLSGKVKMVKNGKAKVNGAVRLIQNATVFMPKVS